jgi:hypothetical protein
MSNRFTTTVSAKGSTEALARFKANHLEGEFDLSFNLFESVIPSPKGLRPRVRERRGPLKYNIPADEIPTQEWDDWWKKNWGAQFTFWLSLERDELNVLEFAFETPWYPPEPVLRRLRVMYPDISFKFFGHEEFEGDVGEVAAKLH